jgi:hypothetical protein
MKAGRGINIFVDELTRFARQTADQRVMAVAERGAAPLRVVVRGRRGVGCSTVARALERAGGPSGLTVVPPGAADLQVYVVAEVVKPEDSAALRAGGTPALAVLNKADLTGFAGDGPMVAAGARCARFTEMISSPMLAMSGLLAVAALDDLDVWAELHDLATHPDGLACLDGSFDGFLTAQLPVPVVARRRLLQVLDLFGIAVAVAALRGGCGPAQLRALLRRVSGIDAVIEALIATGAPVRYRRVLDAVAELEALAASDVGVGEQIGAFLSRDDTVVARMTAAMDAAQACGLDPGPTAPLPRAVHWQRYSRASVGDLHRACGTDIARGSLRLWSRAGGAPLRQCREAR